MNVQQQSRQTAVEDERRAPAASAASQKASAPIGAAGQAKPAQYAGQQRVDPEKVKEVETAILNFVADSVAEQEGRS